MSTNLLEQIRTSLIEKRDTLSSWVQATPESERQIQLGSLDEQAMQSHMEVVDACLEKAEAGTLGECIVCHETVDRGLLEMDYTASVCLEHLSTQEMRSLELELELAQTVQQSLLPQQAPASPFLEVAAFSKPAQVVSGDYFDFIPFRDGAEGLAIADVAGHGISASLHMASLQALLRTLVPASSSPAEVADHLHRLLIHNVRFSTFVTLFLASFDPNSHTLTYCNAGHQPPLLLRGQGNTDQASEWLWPTGAAIGLVEVTQLREASIQLAAGDTLVLFTDGVTEATNQAGEEFGRERLAGATRKWPGSPARELVQAIRSALAEFNGEQPPADDTTIIACRIVG